MDIDQEEYINLINSQISNKEYVEALNNLENLRKYFPEDHHGYSLTAKIYLELHDYKLAEKYSKLGINESGHIINYTNLASALYKQKKFDEVLTILNEIRILDSTQSLIYTMGANTCLRQKKYTEAEKFCLDGMKYSPSYKNSLNLAAIYIKIGKYDKVINILKGINNKKVARRADYYNFMACAYIKLRDYSKAEDICKQGIKNAYSLEHLANLSIIYTIKKQYDLALNLLKQIRLQFPFKHTGYSRAVYIFLQINDFDSAERICVEGIKNAPCEKLYNLWAEIPLIKNYPIKYENIQETLQRYFIQYLNCMSISVLKTIINLYAIYSTDDFIKYNLLLTTFLKNNSNTTLQEVKKDKLICFLLRDNKHFSYYKNIVNSLTNRNIDIVFEKNDINFDSKLYSKFNIYYGIDNCTKYDVILTDISCFSLHVKNANQNKSKYTKLILSWLKSKIIIGLYHSIDVSIKEHILKNYSCVILENPKQLKYNTAVNIQPSTSNNLEIINNISPVNKTEIAATGLYHLDDCDYHSQSKSLLRNQLEELLEAKLPVDKPILGVLEDEVTLLGQLVTGLNKISKFATIILKPLSTNNYLLKKLSPSVLIYPDTELAPNLLRFSSDFILAGYLSGTFVSSVMIGINIIPYYSRFIKLKKESSEYIKPIFWSSPIPNNFNILETTSQTFLLHNFYKFNYLFDILDANKIKNAIYEDKYINWYKENLSRLQKEGFGDYLLKGSAEKTSEYIIKFAQNGTLGKNCNSILLK